MKIHLINPAQLDEQGGVIRLKQEWSPGLTLPYLAAMIPPGHEIKVTEDSVQEINYEEPVDLVGITAMTSRVSRAYHIAAEYRRRGVPVIMGGFHASFMTEEALKHCDAVVVGEAEGLFESILADLESGELKSIYRRDSWHSMENLPIPRYDLIDFDNYFIPLYPVQVVRGCPNQCEFCCVTTFYGNKYRYRPMEDVIRDIEQAGPLIFFIDDNLTIDQDYALELFQRLKPLERYWLMQSDISIIRKEKLLQAASEAGCIACYIGFESIHRRDLKSMRKNINRPEDYSDAVNILKNYQIDLFASMMVGFENDQKESFDQLKDFLLQAKVPFLCIYILTPLPGSKLYKKIFESREHKIPPWEIFDACHSTYPATSMGREELEERYWELQRWFYSWPSIIRRLVFPPHLGIRFNMIFFNLLIRKKVRQGVHPWKGIPHGIPFRRILRMLIFLSTNAKVRKLIKWIRFLRKP